MAYLIPFQSIVSISKKHFDKISKILYRYRKDTHVAAKGYLIGASRRNAKRPLSRNIFRYLFDILLIFLQLFFNIFQYYNRILKILNKNRSNILEIIFRYRYNILQLSLWYHI